MNLLEHYYILYIILYIPCAIVNHGHIRPRRNHSVVSISPWRRQLVRRAISTAPARSPMCRRCSYLHDGPPRRWRRYPNPGQPLPHHAGNPPKMLILRQDAHAGDISLLVSFLGSLARGALPDTDSHYRANAYPSVCYHRRTGANRGRNEGHRRRWGAHD